MQDKYAVEKKEIKDLFDMNKGGYGYSRITLEMWNRRYPINHKTVQRLMTEMGLKCKIRKARYRSLRDNLARLPQMSLHATLLLLNRTVNGLPMLLKST